MSTGSPQPVLFCETEPWEQEYFSQRLSSQALVFSPQPLDSALLLASDKTRVLSVFIHSRVTPEVLQQLPALGLVATRSTGFDHIDVAACTQRGILVANVPHYGENTVAEHTFGLILALSRHIHKAYVRTARGDFSLQGLQGFDLQGKSLGVVGAGNIGLHVIRIARGFGMGVLAYDPRPYPIVAEVLGFQYVSLEELLQRSDIISLHLPYNPQTHHLINKETMQRIKPGALLINTARGALVDTEALIWALDEGILAGAGLDVLEGEELIGEEKELLVAPHAEEKLRMLLRQHVLLRRENVVITPHNAFNSREALHRIADTTIENIRGFLEGEPRNLVNPNVLGK